MKSSFLLDTNASSFSNSLLNMISKYFPQDEFLLSVIFLKLVSMQQFLRAIWGVVPPKSSLCSKENLTHNSEKKISIKINKVLTISDNS